MPSSTLLHLHQGEWSPWFSSVDKISRSRHLKEFLEFQECPSDRFHDPGGQRASEAPAASQPIAWAYSFLSRRVAGRAEMMRTTSSETSSKDPPKQEGKKPRHFTLGAGASRPGPGQRAGAF